MLHVRVDHTLDNPADDRHAYRDALREVRGLAADSLQLACVWLRVGCIHEPVERARGAHAHRKAARAEVVAVRHAQHAVRERLREHVVPDLRARLHERARDHGPVVRDEADGLAGHVEDAKRRAPRLYTEKIMSRSVPRKRDNEPSRC
jgi:hypothetical protein